MMNRADAQVKTQVRTKSFIKFCPSCQQGNGAYSISCVYCGKSLNINIAESTKEDSTQYAIPDNGFAVYFQGNAESIATATDKQVVLGRKTEGEAKPIVDLTPLNGFALGVSRHHVVIRSTDKGYMIMDMNSSNGTWLDGRILTPAETYELPSGSTVQLGRLKLVLTYKSPDNKDN